MPIITKNEYCTGCMACISICPQSCIKIEIDDRGFKYPLIDNKRCISCRLCDEFCPVLHEIHLSDKTISYAVINKNDSIRNASTSGGVFSRISEYVLDKGGVIFGAAYNEDYSVSHQYAETANQMKKFCEAKYVQSDIGYSYQVAKEFLDKDRVVLFSGTPCQIAGLQSFLRKEYYNLICLDLICHGVPSPEVWQYYINYRSKVDNKGVRPININLRSKITGWQQYSVDFQYSNNRYSSIYYADPYMHGYLCDLYTRPSCFDCRFKGINRNSDFTLGDYWGIESQHPEMNDGMGTSLVFVHTEKGKNIWKDIASDFRYLEVESDIAIRWNPMAVRSTPYQKKQEEFFKRFRNEDFEKLVWELVPKPQPQKRNMFRRIINKVKKVLKR